MRQNNVLKAIPWIDKYSPSCVAEIIGQQKALKIFKSEIDKVVSNPKSSKALLLYGPTGSGKTSLVQAYAKENDLELIEINASDFRKKDQIQNIIGNSINQMSLFMKEKLILIDEVDCISGKSDFGGTSALLKLMKGSRYPFVLTANDPYDKKLKNIRKRSILIEFDEVSYLDIFEKLKKIADKEEIIYEDSLLKSLARMSGGDVRAAINDLQLSCFDGKITKADVELLSSRDKESSIKDALLKIFKTTDTKIAISSLDSIDLDTAFLWIDENLPKEYDKPKDLLRAYEWLCLADVFRGRIRRWQSWRFLLYVNAFMSGGIAVSKDKRYSKMPDYSDTKRILKIWLANMKYQKRKDISALIASNTHTSLRRALQDSFPYVKAIFKNGAGAGLDDWLDLSSDQVAWLNK